MTSPPNFTPRYMIGDFIPAQQMPGSAFDRAIIILSQINTAVQTLQALADELSKRLDAVERQVESKINLADLADFKRQVQSISDDVKRLVRQG